MLWVSIRIACHAILIETHSIQFYGELKVIKATRLSLSDFLLKLYEYGDVRVMKIKVNVCSTILNQVLCLH